MKKISFWSRKKSPFFLVIVCILLLGVFLLWPEPTYAASLSQRVDAVKNSWRWMLNFIDYFVVIFLILIAFINILRINIDAYAVKKTLPNLVLSVMLANFSWFICKMFIDLAAAIVVLFERVGNSAHGLLWKLYEMLMAPILTATGASVSIGVLLNVIGGKVGETAMWVAFAVGILVLLLPLILFAALWFLLLIRVYAVCFLVIASPLAFIALGFPLTTKFFQMWWKYFSQWVFMGPAVAFLLAFAYVISKTVAAATPGAGAWTGAQLTKYILICATLYFALRVPFLLGGGVMSWWGGIGKRIGLWGARWADKSIGDFTQNKTGYRASPYTLYKGWVSNADRYWKQHEGEGTGTGEDIREGVLGIPRRYLEVRKEIAARRKRGEKISPEEEKRMLQEAREIPSTRADQARMEQNNKEAEIISKDSSISNVHLNNSFQAAVDSNNQNEARKYLLAKALRGTLTQEDIKNYLSKFDKEYRASNGERVGKQNLALLNSANRASQAHPEEGGLPIVNPYTQDANGRVIKKTPEQMSQDAARDLQRLYDKDKTSRVHVLRNAANLLAQTELSKFGAEHQVAKQFLSGVVATPYGKKFIEEAGLMGQIDQLQKAGKLPADFSQPSLNLPSSQLRGYSQLFAKDGFDPNRLKDEHKFIMFQNAEQIKLAAAKSAMKARIGDKYASVVDGSIERNKGINLEDIERSIRDSSAFKGGLGTREQKENEINGIKNQADQLKVDLDEKGKKVIDLIPDLAGFTVDKDNMSQESIKTVVKINQNEGLFHAGFDKTFQMKLKHTLSGMDKNVQTVVENLTRGKNVFSEEMKGQVWNQIKDFKGIDLKAVNSSLEGLHNDSNLLEEQKRKLTEIKDIYERKIKNAQTAYGGTP